MARKNTISFLKTTRGNLNTQASANALIPGEPYLITDENRIAVALSVSTYQTYLKEGEGGGGGSSNIDGGAANSVAALNVDGGTA